MQGLRCDCCCCYLTYPADVWLGCTMCIMSLWFHWQRFGLIIGLPRSSARHSAAFSKCRRMQCRTPRETNSKASSQPNCSSTKLLFTEGINIHTLHPQTTSLANSFNNTTGKQQKQKQQHENVWCVWFVCCVVLCLCVPTKR